MAKKKRSASLQEDPEYNEVDLSDDEVMSEEEEEESEENTHRNAAAADGEIPFLDTFYGLASASPTERAQSAHAMLHHCLLVPSANTKDAAYAFRRLLNGLCSGRAAARQGYASAFSSFLKIAFSTGALKEIQGDMAQDESSKESLLMFVRNQLLKTTDPGQAQSGKFGKTKGSEERDYQFGRLFGILSIVRSGILVPSEENDLSEVTKTSVGLVNDLLELYHYKKWMREPTAHGIITLMNSLYDAGSSDQSKAVLDNLVRGVVVPKLFASKAVDHFTAEQIAVAVSIQSHHEFFQGELPSPLDQAIVSSATIPTLVESLSATSSVVHPRMHVLWDVLWLFLSEETKENSRIRTLRESCPISDESASRVVEALMKSLVSQSLLAIGTEAEGNNPTHERRALALTIVKAACGGQLNSSTTGPFVISIDLNLLEDKILSQDVVKRLFLDVICAGGGIKQGAHMLKPLALHVLEAIAESEAINGTSSDSALARRLSLVQTLLVCDPRFDGKTKTATISSLLLLDDSAKFTYCQGHIEMWTKYIDFLEAQILRTSSDGEGDLGMKEDGEQHLLKPSSYETLGYIDLLFNVAKRILRLQVIADDEAKFEAFRSTIIQRILGFLMASAFFDCSDLTEQKKPKKKKWRKETFDGSEMHSVVEAGLRIKESIARRNLDQSTIPCAVRVILSSRFFSLLADCISMATSAKPAADAPGHHKQGKDARVLGVLSDIMIGWISLEERGARSLSGAEETGDESNETNGVKAAACTTVREMQQEANALLQKSAGSDDDDKSLSSARCKMGTAILTSTLCLHLLRCGTSDELVDEIDEDDDEDDDDDIVEMITDLQSIPTSLIDAELSKESLEDETSSPLLGLAELCIHVLSSPFGSGGQSRGASPKLLREAVKFAWIGGLSSYALADDNAVFDDDVLIALLRSIGASPEEAWGQNDGESDAGNEKSDSDEGGQDEAMFSKAAGEALGLDDDESDVEMKDEDSNVSADEEEDVELDPAQLESLLLEDSDAILDDDDSEGGELEHHAGADAALAQLIKLKRDARKAGRQALERLEIARQLRCVVLLDTLLANPGRQWSNLLQASLFTKMVLPLLQARRGLERALDKASAKQLGKKAAGLDNDKGALLERLTSLLKTKICKIRWSKDVQPDTADVVKLAVELMNQAKQSKSTEHTSCCSSSLLALLKSVPDVDVAINASSVYGEALYEWATKRTTNLSTSLFDDFVLQLPRYIHVADHLCILRATGYSHFDILYLQSCSGCPRRPFDKSDQGNAAVPNIGIIQTSQHFVQPFWRPRRDVRGRRKRM